MANNLGNDGFGEEKYRLMKTGMGAANEKTWFRISEAGSL
jgi:hypothetical protein